MSDFAALAPRLRFVLVTPSLPANIGAAARAVHTMGFTQLVVVAPDEPAFKDDPQARALATHATQVLAQAQVLPSLASALAGVTRAYGMTGYARQFGPPLVELRDAVAESHALLRAQPAGDIAFVFGPERNGLLNEDVERCQACCAIAADPEHGSLNLAQAVQVTAYECRRAMALGSALAPSPFADEPPADLAAVEKLYGHLEQALLAVGYLDPAAPGRLMARLRRLFNRAGLTQTEIDVLRGICAAMEAPKHERAGRKRGRVIER